MSTLNQTRKAALKDGDSNPVIFNRALRDSIVAANPVTLLELWASSPVRLHVNAVHVNAVHVNAVHVNAVHVNAVPSCEEVLTSLFSPNGEDPMICAGIDKENSGMARLSDWKRAGKLRVLQIIVPNPMRSAGVRRFCVIECDTGTIDEQAAVLWHLSEFGPLALVVHSCGKSLHGWFYCEGAPEDEVKRWFDYAVSLGADRSTWTRNQFVRMPGGTRYHGDGSEGRQSVCYLDPATITPFVTEKEGA